MLDFVASDADRLDEGPIGQVLTELFDLHRAMLQKLVTHDAETATFVAEFLEDVANRYLDLSEEILRRRGARDQRLNNIE